MTRSILCGLMAVLSVGAVGALPLACQSGGVGDPCTPEDEYSVTFSGFKVAEENIESRSFQCQTRLCLVNHFQGRVSCPAGQATPKQCDPTNNGSDCSTGETCVLAQTYAPTCVPCATGDTTCTDTCKAIGSTEACNQNSNTCECSAGLSISGVSFACEPAACGQTNGVPCKTDSDCDSTHKCDSSTNQCRSTAGCPQVLNAYVCHHPADTTRSYCQTPGTTTKPPATCKTDTDCGTNYWCSSGTCAAKECCVPGTDSPVAVDVCGQCNDTSKRDADQAVYCTGRCCAPCCPPCNDGTTNLCEPKTDDPSNPSCSTDTSICGPACDPNFNYISCPSGFSCVGIRTNVGLGDAELAGAYCIKSGTAFLATSAANCGAGAQGGFVADMSCQP
jgi:hypothetical protein